MILQKSKKNIYVDNPLTSRYDETAIVNRGFVKDDYLVIILGQFFLFLLKNLCCEYSLEVLTEALLMSTHNIYFYGEIGKMITELSPNTPA